MRRMIRPNYINDDLFLEGVKEGHAFADALLCHYSGLVPKEDEGCNCSACNACYERAKNNEVEAEIDRMEEEK